MIRINRENTLAMSRKRNPALDGYLDRINLLLWPRLKVGCGEGGWRPTGSVASWLGRRTITRMAERQVLRQEQHRRERTGMVPCGKLTASLQITQVLV